MIRLSFEDNITVLNGALAPHHEYLWSESESPAGSHRTAEDDFVHVEWNMIMAPVTTERIAAPIYLPVRPAAEVIGEWREDSLFIEPDKTRPPIVSIRYLCEVGELRSVKSIPAR